MFRRLFKNRDEITRKFYLVIALYVAIGVSILALGQFRTYVLDSVRGYTLVRATGPRDRRTRSIT